MAAALMFDAAYRQIKRGALAPVYYLTGAEDVLKDELVALIVDRAVDPANRDFNIDVRSAADLDGESLHALVETPPMLAERRVVVVRNLEQWRRNAKVWQVLDRYVTRPSPTTILILIHGGSENPRKDLASEARHVIVDALTPGQLARWVMKRATRVGCTIGPDAAEHLVSAVGDMSQLTMEVEKLAAAAGGDTVEVEDVARMVGVRRGETSHDWVAAVLVRDFTQAIGMLETVLASSGVNGVRLVAALGTALIGVRLARSLADAGVPPGRIQRAVFDQIRAARPPGLRSWKDEAAIWTSAAPRWTSGDLDLAIRTAYDADRALKSTTVRDDRATLVDMLLSMCPREAVA